MSGEWGPWIGWNGSEGEKPFGDHVRVQFVNEHGYMDECDCGELWFDNIIAYRVKKKPVIEEKQDLIFKCSTGKALNATCTYKDGKLIKIHWEAEDAD